MKEAVKLFIGREGILDDNIKRQHYNMLLSDAYSPKDTVFDLALVESIDSDGFRYYSPKDGEKVIVMVPQYTYDGGHLNKEGIKKVAEQLLVMLARN